MKSRRGFFKRLAQAAAVIALAPQIAFKAPVPSLNLTDMLRQCYEIQRVRSMDATDQMDIFCDRYTANLIQDIMIKYYKERYAA